MAAIVEVENLSKKYLIYHQHRGYSTLVDTLSYYARKGLDRVTQAFSGNKQSQEKNFEEFYALKNVSFSIQEGDRVGIIGRNGAGKSTLLKIVSRITQPSSGKIKIRGRVSSLLEVGTGFHLELTGRENIFLNGAVLGMRHQEIKKKFDEIVAFAEIEKFLDTPVKRYSSGMYMRLGFAIAAHLDPDLLIVDEVLSVGDSQFQDKCLKKLNDLGTTGRTILYVSHDISTVLNICNKGIFLEKGVLKQSGAIDDCVSEYVRSCKLWSMHWEGDFGDEHIRFYRASLRSDSYNKDFFYQGESVTIEMEYEILKPLAELSLGITIWNTRNQLLARSRMDNDSEHLVKFLSHGKQKIYLTFDSALFHEGEYLIKIESGIYNNKIIFDDEIVLKLPIYSPNKNMRFSHLIPRDGVLLGNQWKQL